MTQQNLNSKLALTITCKLKPEKLRTSNSMPTLHTLSTTLPKTPQLDTTNMSCKYYGNVSQAPTHGNPQNSTSGTSSGRGGRAYQVPQPPIQQQQQQQHFSQQQPPTLPNFGQGFVTYTNPPMVGGFGSPSLPPYYAGGYAQGPMYALLSGPQNQPTPSAGWGKPSLIAPPLRLTCSEPS
jgi:hypothetical protein